LSWKPRNGPQKAVFKADQKTSLLEVFCNNQLETTERGEALLAIDLDLSMRRYDLQLKGLHNKKKTYRYTETATHIIKQQNITTKVKHCSSDGERRQSGGTWGPLEGEEEWASDAVWRPEMAGEQCFESGGWRWINLDLFSMDEVWDAQQEEKEKGRWQRVEAGDKPSLWWWSCTLWRKTNKKNLRTRSYRKQRKKMGQKDGGLGGGKRQSSSLLPTRTKRRGALWGGRFF